MKKVLSILMALAFLSMVSVGYAGPNAKAAVKMVNGSGQIRTGVTNIKAVNIYSSAAGDYVNVFDAVNATGGTAATELLFEVAIGANTSSNSITTGVDGIEAQTGVYVASNNAGAVLSVVYDY